MFLIWNVLDVICGFEFLVRQASQSKVLKSEEESNNCVKLVTWDFVVLFRADGFADLHYICYRVQTHNKRFILEYFLRLKVRKSV